MSARNEGDTRRASILLNAYLASHNPRLRARIYNLNGLRLGLVTQDRGTSILRVHETNPPIPFYPLYPIESAYTQIARSQLGTFRWSER